MEILGVSAMENNLRRPCLVARNLGAGATQPPKCHVGSDVVPSMVWCLTRTSLSRVSSTYHDRLKQLHEYYMFLKNALICPPSSAVL